MEEMGERTRIGKLNFRYDFSYCCLRSTSKETALLLLCGFSTCVFTWQSKTDLLGLTFSFSLSHRLYVVGCWPPVLPPPSLPPPPPLWPQQCHSPYMGEGSSQELGCRCIFSKHNNLKQWSLSTFLCSSKTWPALLPVCPHTPWKGPLWVQPALEGEVYTIVLEMQDAAEKAVTEAAEGWEGRKRCGRGGRGREREGRRGGGETGAQRENLHRTRPPGGAARPAREFVPGRLQPRLSGRRKEGVPRPGSSTSGGRLQPHPPQPRTAHSSFPASPRPRAAPCRAPQPVRPGSAPAPPPRPSGDP